MKKPGGLSPHAAAGCPPFRVFGGDTLKRGHQTNARRAAWWPALLSVFLFLLAARADAADGLPLWTNRYDGPIGSGDVATAVVVDSSGNVFVTGWSRDTGSSNDFATIKYSGAGVPLWTNRYNGTGNSNDQANAIAVDGSGNVFVTGHSHGGSGYYDYATVAYSGAGVPLWTNRYNGPGNDNDIAYALAVDGGGNVFVTGYSYNGANVDYATVAYSGAGTPLWTNRYNGPGNANDQANAIALDASGNVFVTGQSSGSGSSDDYATIKYSGAGTPLWTNRYDGPGNNDDRALAVAVDAGGNVFVTGNSDGGGSSYDYATIKYSGAGAPLWTNRYDGPGSTNDVANAVAVDGGGNVFVTGYSRGSGTGDDYATIKYSNAGAPLWTNRYDGPGNSDDNARSIAVDASGNVFVTGESKSTVSAGSEDFATVAYSGAGTPLWTNRYDGPGNSTDNPRAMTVDKNGNVFVTGNSAGSGTGDDYATIKYSTAPPVITSLSTNAAAIGSSLTITGANFSTTLTNNIVWFGAVRATVTAGSGTNLTVTVPTGATFAPVSVTVNGLTVQSTARFTPTFTSSQVLDNSSFTNVGNRSVSSTPQTVEIADLDGDGKPDLISSLYTAQKLVLFRNTNTTAALSANTFDAGVELSGTGSAVTFLAVGDVDGDGKLDLVSPSTGDNFIRVYLNAATAGSLAAGDFATAQNFSTLAGPYRVAIGDLDGDGKPEIVVAYVTTAFISVFRNTGSAGSLSSDSFATRQDYPVGASPRGVALADVDGDGKLDIVVANYTDSSAGVLRNQSTPGTIDTNSFAAHQAFAFGSNPHTVAVGDIDGDGKLDLVLPSRSNDKVAVLRNTATPGTINSNSFAGYVEFGVSSIPVSAVLADLDGDGKLDIVASSATGQAVSVLKNQASSGSITTSSFVSAVILSVGVNLEYANAGDLDGDGRPDIVTATYSAERLDLFRNTVNVAPVITVQPQSQTVLAGTNVNFGVTISGTPPLFYQWRKGGVSISDATNTAYSLSNVSSTDAANYDVVITNSYGSVTSAVAVLTVNSPPSITAQPQSQTVLWGTNVSFSVTAGGSAPLSYQWRKGGVDIGSATNSAYSLTGVTANDAGNFAVVVTNAFGSVTSAVAVLTVLMPDGTPLWTNRYVGPGNLDDEANSVAVDGAGNVFVTGFSYNSTDADFSTIKYSNNGTPLWTNRYNGPGNGNDLFNSMVLDNTGNAIVTGSSGGSGTSEDYATIKYSNSGTPLWTNRYDGPVSGSDSPKSVAVDSAGNVFVTGMSWNGGNYDYATIKYLSNGTPAWTNRYNGPATNANNWDEAKSVAVDGAGNVFVTGKSHSGANYDYATIKYLANGTPAWTNRYNGAGNNLDEAWAVAVDSAGNVFVTGASVFSGSTSDYATIKYLTDGTPVWTNRYNGPGNNLDSARAVVLDSTGNVYVSGLSIGSGTSYDYATIKYLANGTPVWTNRYNGTGNGFDEVKAMTMDKAGNIFVTGNSPNGINDDYVTIKYLAAGTPVWTNRYNGPDNGPDRAFSLAADGAGNVFVTGHSQYSANTNSDYVTIKYAGNNVTTVADSGPGSLRAAVSNAAPGDTITFDLTLSGQTITLTSGQITLDKNLTIDASALAAGIAINGNNASRAFYLASGATNVLNSLTFTNCSNAGGGGAIDGYGDNIDLTLNDCSFINNASPSGAGGAVLLESINGFNRLTANRCTFSGNTAGTYGGAVASARCEITLNQCTIAGNYGGNVGGVYGFFTSLLVNQSTVVGNTCGGGGVGGVSTYYNASLTLFNSIVAGNGNGSEVTVANTLLGFNLTNGTPQLAPLGNYGGKLKTMPPLSGSPALDAGDDSATNSFATDQRGFTRLTGAHVDIGAVEATLVTTLADGGAGSLRSTISNAVSSDIILFATNLSGGAILLTNGQITLTNNFTIDASGLAAGIAINGNNASRIFNVPSGAGLTLIGLTLTNANGGGGNNGGAIRNLGTTLLQRCTLVGNTTGNAGGAAHNEGGGSLTLTNCTITGNTAPGGGGGLSSWNSSPLVVTHCTITTNTGSYGGGGIYNFMGPMTVANSIIAGNTSSGSPAGADIRNEGNTTATVTRVGANLIQNFNHTATGTDSGQAAINAAPLLAALGSYGGPTMTMPPRAGSPAIDAATNGIATTDQRGVARPLDGTADIGAVEANFSLTLTNLADSGAGSLRQMISNAIPGSTITFATNLSGATITLTSGQIVLNKSLTIDASALPVSPHLNADNSGRVLFVGSGTTNVLTALTITNGYTGANGGGILSFGVLTMNDCTVSGNTANFGGGIFSSNTFTANRCTFSGNAATGLGGGLRANYYSSTLNQCTFAGNSASSGGGIYSYRNNFTLNQSTISANTSSSDGGGVWVDQPTSTTIFNSLIVGNTGSTEISFFQAFTLNLNGVNLTNGTPLLAPLGNYGGPTKTMPPLPGSPAIDAGSDTATNSFATDQRGFTRLSGTHVDIGAVEANLVTTLADDGAGSLRGAISNALSGDYIVFATNLAGGTMVLTNGTITLSKNLTIDGSGLAAGITINGNNAGRAFVVNAGVTNTLNRLTITNCTAAGVPDSGYGAGIHNSGTLALVDCTIAGCSAFAGGAIYNGNSGSAVLMLNNCTFSGNAASHGGGIQNEANTYATNCTFSGNDGSVRGGAISAGFGRPVVLTHCTLSGNTSAQGGGIHIGSGGTTLHNTIVAGNTATTGADIDGTPTLAGNNLTNGTPLLAALGSYGGPTMTMPPLFGSAAINAATGSTLTTDQRGFARPNGIASDIGAVETVLNAPTDIALSATNVFENLAIGTAVGTFTATDADGGDTFTFTLVSGTGDGDNAGFSVANGTNLVTAAVFDFETKNSYAIRVRATDSTGNTFEKQFTITIANVNDAPTLTIGDLAGTTWTARESGRVWQSVASSSDGTKLVAVVNGGQLYTSTDSGANWTARESSRNWFSVASSTDGTKLVAAVYGGQLYTSTDSGATWTARDSSRPWSSVASSADGTKVVAVAGAYSSGQIYTSTDSGTNWTARESSRQWYSVASSADGTKLVVAEAGGPLYTSTDSGVTWTPHASVGNRNWTYVASSTDGTKLAATVGGGQLYTSADSGVTWTARDSSRDWYAVASSADGTRLVATDYGFGSGGRIYTSMDSGVTWTARESVRLWKPVASSSDGTKLVAGVEGGQLYTSAATGVSSLSINEDAGAQTVNLSGISAGAGESQTLTVTTASSNTALIPTPGVTYTSANTTGSISFTPVANASGTVTISVTVSDNGGTANGGVDAVTSTFTVVLNAVNDAPTLTVGDPAGATWTARESSREWLCVASSADGTKLVAGARNGGQLYTSTDSGVSWTARESSRTWQAVASSDDGSKLVAVAGGGQIYTSTDSGTNWTARESNRGWHKVASSADGSKLVAAVSPGQIYTSTDSGVSWTARESSRSWYGLASSADGSKLVATANGGQIYTSTDSGTNWTARESSRLWHPVASSADGIKLIAAENPGQIYTSTDSGVNWTARESSRPWGAVASSADGSELVAVLNGGQIYTSTDSGVTWTARESSRSWQAVASSADGIKLVAAVLGGQIYTSAGFPSSLALNEDVGAQTVNLSGISAGPGESQTLTVTTTSSNTALIPTPGVTYTSANATGSISFTPAANASGTATITVIVSDDGGTASGGVDAVTNTFTVMVNAVNDAPTLAAISNLAADSWTVTQTNSAPAARGGHSAVWTGSELIVWGGFTAGLGSDLNTGARYNPVSNTWTAIS
ncbi:MAG: SBBP repeat-containing protein, partial [Verrucomicrobia bacterium]|nr:SBBP repeat-containing protein [Verrucomicrobiota bacterium]